LYVCIKGQGVVVCDDNVETKVPLVAIDEKGPVDVSLHHVLLLITKLRASLESNKIK
jgi:hypothetical protein